MRWDGSLDQGFKDAPAWLDDPVTGRSGAEVDRYTLPPERMAKLSLSGSERNHMFVKAQDGEYIDVSGNSGFDTALDGRAIALFDYNRDGLQDFLLTNSNDKTLRVYRSGLKELGASNGFIAVRLVGGRVGGDAATESFSNRDAIGARIVLEAKSGRVVRELRAGEGFAAQNSRTVLVGLGAAGAAREVRVEWPSGKRTDVGEVPSGQLVTVFENPAAAPGGAATRLEAYSPVSEVGARARKARPKFPLAPKTRAADVTVFCSMATWCKTCLAHLPELDAIHAAFGGRVRVVAIPVDPKDDKSKLDAYVQQHKPKYTLLPPDMRRAAVFMEFLNRQVGNAGVPYSAIVAPNGEMLEVLRGFPTISAISKARSEAN